MMPQAEITEVTPEPTEDLPDTNVEIITQQRQEQNKIRRPRSAGDISETLHQCTAAAASVTGISTFHRGAVSGNATGATGIVANNNNKTVSDLRYTKFPLSYGKNSTVTNTTVAAARGECSNSNKLSDAASSSPSPSSSLSAINRHKSKLCRSLDSPQADLGVNESSSSPSTSFSESSGVISSIPPDLPFEESQIHFTAATKTYTHPHRSPIPLSKPNTSSASSSGNFLTNTVSSIGRRVVNSVTPGSKSKHNKSKLKVKSKSDNSLHRVHSNVNVNSVIVSGQSSNSGDSSSVGVPRNASASAFTSYADNQSSVESGGAERRLNSVQLGDHATIRLPWTGFQQINNLSSVSSTRAVIPNTHNNNFEFPSTTAGLGSSERYVECGSSLRTATPAAVVSSFGNNNREINCGPSRVNTTNASGSSRIIVTRRRSRSLERCSNFRVLPINNNNNSGVANVNTSVGEGLPSSSQSLFWREVESRIGAISRSQSRKETGAEREKQRTRSAHSLERNTSYRQPPRRPDKPSKPSIFPGSSGSNSVVAASRGGRKDKHRCQFEKLHRSAPNSSFSNSSESGESSYSAPPSPPPRPPSTLKPESRLIIHPTQQKTTSSSAIRRTNITSPTSCLHSQGPFPPNSGNSIIMNPVPKRRPVAPRSHGSSSDSGVSHISSTSTVRGTSDFSDESGGSVNISQHSQHSASVVSHSTTSSSGVSHHSSSAASNAVPSATAGISLEDVRNSGFINKPSKGWLHSDQMLSKEGVTYTVRRKNKLQEEMRLEAKILDLSIDNNYCIALVYLIH
ncbi:hypothetical protein Ocin01_11059 [Orchesella cincta]|uniref:Uncharacterized protein n=1 Tax=Orchesella cincta TaxID=48709 RepID=A0A1D2MRK4_ORCCI|nr:hypothetical protein Ocin01_11059 [Orchesella cincta]